MKKKILLGVLLAFVLVICFVGYSFFSFGKEVKNLTYHSISMNTVQDGNYDGDVSTSFIKVKVNVEVKDYQIKNIKLLKHDHGLGKEAEKIIDVMIKENSDAVDAITGATASSEVIRSAVNQALHKGVQ